MKQKGSSDVKGYLWKHLDKKVLLWHREALYFSECIYHLNVTLEHKTSHKGQFFEIEIYVHHMKAFH